LLVHTVPWSYHVPNPQQATYQEFHLIVQS
jgi:hypothetical protein